MSCDFLGSSSIRKLPHPADDNPICSIISSVIGGVVAVAFSLPFLLIFFLVFPVYLSVRWLLLLVHCNKRGPTDQGPESVCGNASRWLGTEWRSSVIHAVLKFEAKEGVHVDHFRQILLERVIPLYPRLKQRLIFLPPFASLGNCWVTDAKFSIDQHVFSGPSVLSNEKDLQDYVSELLADGLPEDKSPWQLQVFQSFGTNRDTVVILRVHQSVADGTALMKLLCYSLADSQIIEIPGRPTAGPWIFCMNLLKACIVAPLTLLLWIFFSKEDSNILTHRSSWTGSVTVSWSASITLSKINRIKQVTRSTVNCVLLSALAGALRRLLQGCGVAQPSDLNVVVPMDLRDQTAEASIKTKLSNKTSSAIMPLPVAVEGCVPRLWATRKTLDSLRSSADPVVLYVATAALMSIGSASFARHLFKYFTDKASVQFSSIPGPTSEVLLEGQALKGIYPIMPAQANLGISITIITYADQVFVSVLAERALGPAAELILKYLEDQIDVLWKLLLNRRVPGEHESSASGTKANTTHVFPSQEEDEKERIVKGEANGLNESVENPDKNGKMATLKMEFSNLVDEIKSRESLCEVDVGAAERKHHRRRALSCSNTKRYEVPSTRRSRRQRGQSARTSHQRGGSDREKKGGFSGGTISGGAKPAKEWVINISEKDVKLRPAHRNSAMSNSNGKSARVQEAKPIHRHKSDYNYKSDNQKRTTHPQWDKPKRDKFKKTNSNSPDVKSNSIISVSLTIDDLSKEENGGLENFNFEALPLGGPNDGAAGRLEAFQVDEKQNFYSSGQPSHYLNVRKQDKSEDSDESEIAGGVLI